MSYTLQAIVADKPGELQPKVGKFVPRPQGKILVPLTASLRNQYSIPELPFEERDVDAIENLIRNTKELIDVLGLKGKVAYLEAMFFGGVGYQAALVWDNGEVLMKPLNEQHAINAALKVLGIEKGESSDEFSALALGEHRNINQW